MKTQAEKNEVLTLCSTWGGVEGALSHLRSHRECLLFLAATRPYFRRQVKDCERRIALLETAEECTPKATNLDKALLERFGADELYSQASAMPGVIERLVRSGLIERRYA